MQTYRRIAVGVTNNIRRIAVGVTNNIRRVAVGVANNVIRRVAVGVANNVISRIAVGVANNVITSMSTVTVMCRIFIWDFQGNTQILCLFGRAMAVNLKLTWQY